MCVVFCNQEIIRLHTEERKFPDTPIHLGADHTLPIYLFVVSRTDIFLQRPLQTLQLLQTLTDSRLRDGEAGYYLTMCASAVEFIIKDGHRPMAGACSPGDEGEDEGEDEGGDQGEDEGGDEGKLLLPGRGL
jgi:hypothetical protein